MTTDKQYTDEAYVTTDGRCSFCRSKLFNAETAHRNWQNEACELQKQLTAAKQLIVKLTTLLDEAAHSVYCNDPKEQKRLGLKECVACRWQKERKNVDLFLLTDK